MLVKRAAVADLDAVRRLWILNDLFVRPGVRRGGVGRRLLERAREWAVETDAKGLTRARECEPRRVPSPHRFDISATEP